MRQWSEVLVAACAALMISGCGGGGGSGGGTSTAPPPTLASAVPGDGQVTLTWASNPGVYYWVWWVQSTLDVTIGPSGNAVGAEVYTASPYVVGYPTPLINALPYSFAVNAHLGSPNGPGGAQSNSLPATPRLAGSTWLSCTAGGSCPAGAPTLYGITFGENAGLTALDNGAVRNYLAVGAGGSMFVSPDAKNWTALPSQSACTPSAGGALRAADYGWGVYVAVGDNGTLCFSGINPNNLTGQPLDYVTTPTSANWYSALTLPTGFGTPNLYAVTTNENNNWSAIVGSHVAVGSKGTILISSDGENWIPPVGSVATPNDLYGVTYNYCGILPSMSWVAVGAHGTIMGTEDPSGVNGWTNAGVTSNSTQNLRSVACIANTTPVTNPYYPFTTIFPLWVAAGDNGVLLTSIDSFTWSTPTNFKIDGVAATAFPVTIRALTYGTQFLAQTYGSLMIAIGDSGKIFTTIDGANWTSQNSNAAGNTLYAVTEPQSNTIPNGNLGAIPYGYAAVGAGGITIFAQ